MNFRLARWAKALNRIRFRPAFTPVGFALIVIGLFLLIRSLLTRNAFEVLLSVVITLIWILLFAIGYWGKRRLAALEPKWKPPFPFTANTQEESLISGFDINLPWFFRLHVLVRGRFFPSAAANGCPVFAETAVRQGSASVNLLLSFPMSGIFRGEVSCRLRDIFGFFSFRCGNPQKRSAAIACAPILKKPLKIDPQSGAEDRRHKNSDDEERYYMREYAPGDRFRDINWKSSERIDTLITRISPDNNEKVCHIEVCFRNYASSDTSLEDLWLLDRCKARFSQFLRMLKESDDSYIFTVHTAQGTWELDDFQALENFLEELLSMPFVTPVNQSSGPSESGKNAAELYIFSTACDETLPSFLAACHPRRISLFLVEAASRDLKNEEVETLALREFPLKSCLPLPKWLFNKKRPYLSSGSARVEKDYARLRL